MDALFIIVFFAPYVLVPFAIARFYKKHNYKTFADTYSISAVIIFIYPFLLFWLCSLNEASEEHGRCYTPEAMFTIFNTVVLIPVTLVTQWICNKTILKGGKN